MRREEGRLHKRMGKAVRSKEEFGTSKDLPTGQISPRSCPQAGSPQLSRGEGRRTEVLTTGLVWGGPVKKGLLRLGIPRSLYPGQEILWKPPDSRGKPVQVSLAMRICEGCAENHSLSLSAIRLPIVFSENARGQLRAWAWC